MLHGRELVHGPDFKPLVLRHSEEPCKLNPDTSLCKNSSAPAAGGAGGGGSLQQGTPTGSRPWTTGANLQTTGSSEVVQFRRLQYRELTPEDYELLCLLDENIPKKNIAPPSAVTSLPRILARDCQATECQVCLARLEPSIRVVSLPCGHAFHPECIQKWLTQCKGTCPLCNSVLDKDSAGGQKFESASKQIREQITNAAKDNSGMKRETTEDAEDAIAAKKLARANVVRFGHPAACVGGSFIQPGGGSDDIPAE